MVKTELPGMVKGGKGIFLVCVALMSVCFQDPKRIVLKEEDTLLNRDPRIYNVCYRTASLAGAFVDALGQ